jgi:hypothetical protein
MDDEQLDGLDGPGAPASRVQRQARRERFGGDLEFETGFARTPA